MRVPEVSAALSSTALRLLSYVFLRWIPGHPFPNLIFASFAVHLTSASSLLWQAPQPPRQVVGNDPLGRPVTTPSGNSAPQDGTNARLVARTHAWTIVCGVPDRRRFVSSVFSTIINGILVLMVADLTFGPKTFYPSHDLAFARVGYVSENTASILVREPSRSAFPLTLQYRRKDEVLSTGKSAPDRALRTDIAEGQWTEAGLLDATNASTDFTATFVLDHLLPDTSYHFRLSNSKGGTFSTAPLPGSAKSDGTPFTFLHSSCILPNFPYVPFRHHLSVPGFKSLAAQLPALKAQFMLFLGDFIYIDVPRRFGTDLESYRRDYRQVYASPDWQGVSESLPWLHVYDDHEIANDWDRNETGVYRNAADPFTHYQASVNPPSVRPGRTYFSFTQGPASFFLIDTRRYRTPFDGTNGTWATAGRRKSMLGTEQRQDLMAWLAKKEPAGVRWKIVVSSIPWTRNWRFGSEDTWAGYLGERQVILEAMWATSARGDDLQVVVLSGDRHEFAATAFPPPTNGENAHRWPTSATVHEFSASPLSQFYLPIRTYRQTDDADVCLKYLPDGNIKWGRVQIDAPVGSGGQSTLKYELYVDGELAWRYTLTSGKGYQESRTPQLGK